MGLDLWGMKGLVLPMDQLGGRPGPGVSTRGQPPRPAPT